MPQRNIRYMLQNSIQKILKVFNIETYKYMQIFKLETWKFIFLSRVLFLKFKAFLNNI